MPMPCTGAPAGVASVSIRTASTLTVTPSNGPSGRVAA